MNPWSIDPCWQNFSSLFQEINATTEAPNEIGRYHHMTASLYFGMAALEAFINQKMRLHLSDSHSEQEILSVLRKGVILEKLKKWPKEILPTEMRVSDATMQLISLFNEIRGNLTHPKTDGHNIYTHLEEIEPESVFLAIAEYIVRFYEAQEVAFPYWLFGWNYLNPRPDILFESCSLTRIAQMSFNFKGSFCPINLPLFQGSECDAICFIFMIDSSVNVFKFVLISVDKL